MKQHGEMIMEEFQRVIGNERLLKNLTRAVQEDTLAHCYMFEGEKGIGKKTLAQYFSAIIQCEAKTEAGPCMTCQACSQNLHHNHPDIIYVKAEKDLISVDKIRDEVNGPIYIKPYKSDKKIFVIHDADKMNVQAQNALLKTIEEPPSYAMIILLVNKQERMLQTIVSRSVVAPIKPVSRAASIQYLVAQGITKQKAIEATAFAGGNLGTALYFAKDEAFRELMHQWITHLSNIPKQSTTYVFEVLRWLVEQKEQKNALLMLANKWFRDLAICKMDEKTGTFLLEKYREAIIETAKKYSLKSLYEICEEIEKIERRLRLNVNYEISMRVLLNKITDEVLQAQ